MRFIRPNRAYERLTRDTTIPYLCGVYIGISAISDAVLIVDGPYCVVDKTDIQKSHDLFSTLLTESGDARVVFTVRSAEVEEVKSLVVDRTDRVDEVFAEVCNTSDAGAVFTTSFDHHQILNFPLDWIASKHDSAAGKSVLVVPSRALGSDWLEGYGSVLETLAKRVPLEKGRAEAGKVAIIGHLMDRLEMDQVANLRVLERLVGVFGRELAGVWLDGGSYASLQSVERAEVIVAMPYGRKAAHTVGERLGVPVVDVGLPIGLDGIGTFVRALGHAFDQPDVADHYLEAETRAAIGDTLRHVGRFLAGQPVSLDLDPHLADAMVSFCSDVGLRVKHVHLRSALEGVDPELVARVEGAVDPPLADWERVAMAGRTDSYHLVVGGDVLSRDMMRDVVATAFPAIVDLGYPNFSYHPLTERPFFGFEGYRCLVERMSSALLSCARMIPPGTRPSDIVAD